MEKASWVPRAGAFTGLLLLVGSGCVKDFDALSANHGNGGTGGSSASRAGSSGHPAGGSPASGGDNPGEAGTLGVSGEGGEAGEPASGGSATGGRASGGRGGSSSGGHTAGGANCGGGVTTTCPGVTGCVDLTVGTPDGNNVDNCGACGTSCDLTNAASATCATSICALSCNSGLGDCNASTANDGCESDLTTTDHCGSCQNACNLTGALSTACASGACTPTCAPSYGDCNGSAQSAPNDGCEVFFDALDHCTTDCNAASVSCDPTKVCNAGSCAAPAGVAVLSTPLTTSTDATRFADVFPGFPIDLTGASVRVRVYAPGATGGTLTAFVSDVPSSFGSMVTLTLASISQKWTDVIVPVSGVNAKLVKQVNLLVTSSADPVQNPTVLYVDSIRTTNQLVNETFDTSFSGFVTSGLVFVPGSSVSWAASTP